MRFLRLNKVCALPPLLLLNVREGTLRRIFAPLGDRCGLGAIAHVDWLDGGEW